MENNAVYEAVKRDHPDLLYRNKRGRAPKGKSPFISEAQMWKKYYEAEA